MRKNFTRLSIETLESRDNPSGWSFWEDTYVGAFLSGIGEGATNILRGARDAVVETVRVGGDLVTIGATNRGQFDPSRTLLFAISPLGAILTADADQIDPAKLNSRLFQGAAQTAGNPQAAATFDNHLVHGIVTLGVGPLVESGYSAVITGDSTEFSQQAGGFGVMTLVPYGVGRGFGYLRGAGTVADAAEVAGVTTEAVADAPLGARGPASGRTFNPDAAGGPIRQLSTEGVRITTRGIDVVERHLSRFRPDEANQTMLQRLRDIEAGQIEPTQSDLNFYTHELREFVRYRRLGWEEGQPLDAEAAWNLWNDTHTATLEDYGLREGPGVLYHPDIPW